MSEENVLSEMKKAVALRYREQGNDAPQVVATGNGAVADAILALARENGIYIHEDKQLLGLLARLELGAEIPPELYRAVAAVLAFVFKMQGRMLQQEEAGHDKQT